MLNPVTAAWTLSMFELMRAIFVVRKWSDDGDLDTALFRMHLDDVFKLRSHVIYALFFMMTAQILLWLP
jgi:hypothetical protein